MSSVFAHILKNDGIRGLYAGLSASFMRQLTYSTTRFGVYEELKARYTDTGKPATFPILAGIALISGFMGGAVGNFADVLNVRMQIDASLPYEERRNYKGFADGAMRMVRNEGLSSYFRGVLPNANRAAIMTAGQLATYDTFKLILLSYTPMGDSLITHFSASLLAGLTAVTLTSPIDVIKTCVMTSTHKQSMVSVISSLSHRVGLRWVFKGWAPSFLRLGP